MKLPRIFRRVAHSVAVWSVETGAMATGRPIELDPRWTGDNYSPSPLVREVIHADYHSHTESRETITRKRRRKHGKR